VIGVEGHHGDLSNSNKLPVHAFSNSLIDFLFSIEEVARGIERILEGE